jgi:serine phosphatase RsbU (regulator of sigma subunit)
MDKFKTKTIELNHELDILRNINSNDDLNGLLKIFGSEIKKCGLIDNYFISLIDEDEKNLIDLKIKLSKDFKHLECVLTGNKIPLNLKGHFSECYYKGKVVQIKQSEIDEHDEFTKNLFKLRKIFHAVYIPVCNEKIKIGVILIYNHNNNISDESIENLIAVSKLFVNPLYKSLKYTWLSKRKSDIDLLYIRTTEILKIAERINKLNSIDEVYNNILNELIELFGFNFGAILIEKDNFLYYCSGLSSNDDYSKEIFKDIDSYLKEVKGYKLDYSDGATPAAFGTKNYYYFKDIEVIKKLPMSEKDKIYLNILREPKTLLILPIIKDEKAVGIVHLFSIIKFVNLNVKEIDMIMTLCSFIGSAISNSEIYSLVEKQKKHLLEAKNEIEIKNEKFLSDLYIAKKVQESVVKLPLTEHLEIDSKYIAMEGLGGDMYDVRKISPTAYSFMISDVSGHGVAAALITTMAKASFINFGEVNKTTDIICREVNDDLYEYIGETYYYLSAFYCILDIKKMELTYTNCGHQIALLYRTATKTVEELNSEGSLIGIQPDPNYGYEKIHLQTNDKLLLYTDGITEARNENDDFYRYQRLKSFLFNNGHRKPKEFLSMLMNDIKNFCGNREADDDIAVVLIEIKNMTE